jgi:5S rRNA maturation endonuclease (ribonuclease M5)
MHQSHIVIYTSWDYKGEKIKARMMKKTNQLNTCLKPKTK